VLARGRGIRLPDRRQLPLLVALGATGFAGYQLLLSAGEEHVTAGTGALLFAVAPVLVALLARPLLGERLDRRGWAGVALAFCGVATVATAQGVGLAAGAPLVLAGVGLYALWVVLQKRALRTMPAFAVTAWSVWFGAAIATPFAHGLLSDVAHAPAGALAGLLLLGCVVTTVPFLLWAWTLQRLPANRAAPCLLLISPAALVVAWLWLGETPTLAAALGGAVTLAGVALVQLPRRARAKRAQAAPWNAEKWTRAHVASSGPSPSRRLALRRVGAPRRRPGARAPAGAAGRAG
jgi:drug/metabolite transporter (DMT)-like permease